MMIIFYVQKVFSSANISNSNSGNDRLSGSGYVFGRQLNFLLAQLTLWVIVIERIKCWCCRSFRDVQDI
jgi:hypothetical protein